VLIPDRDAWATSGEPFPVWAAVSCGTPYEYTVPLDAGTNPATFTCPVAVLLESLLIVKIVRLPFCRRTA